MATLTKKQVSQLGQTYMRLAQAVNIYFVENYDQLSTKSRKEIRTYYKQLNDTSDYFFLASSKMILNDAEATLNKISAITKDLNKAIAKIKKVQTFVDTFGAAVRLGASIISKQPKAIARALEDFILEFNKFKKESV